MAQMQLLMEKYSGNYEWLKLWMRANFSNPERLALSVIAFNTAVFVLWRIPPLTRFMSRWFLHAPFAGKWMLPLGLGIGLQSVEGKGR